MLIQDLCSWNYTRWEPIYDKMKVLWRLNDLVTPIFKRNVWVPFLWYKFNYITFMNFCKHFDIVFFYINVYIQLFFNKIIYNSNKISLKGAILLIGQIIWSRCWPLFRGMQSLNAANCCFYQDHVTKLVYMFLQWIPLKTQILLCASRGHIIFEKCYKRY